MDPELHEGEYVFCTMPRDGPVPPGLDPVVTVREAEGLTLVLSRDAAENADLAGTFRSAWITLRVRSALTAVGSDGSGRCGADQGRNCVQRHCRLPP